LNITTSQHNENISDGIQNASEDLTLSKDETLVRKEEEDIQKAEISKNDEVLLEHSF
jgi:hypothetical protein